MIKTRRSEDSSTTYLYAEFFGFRRDIFGDRLSDSRDERLCSSGSLPRSIMSKEFRLEADEPLDLERSPDRDLERPRDLDIWQYRPGDFLSEDLRRGSSLGRERLRNSPSLSTSVDSDRFRLLGGAGSFAGSLFFSSASRCKTDSASVLGAEVPLDIGPSLVLGRLALLSRIVSVSRSILSCSGMRQPRPISTHHGLGNERLTKSVGAVGARNGSRHLLMSCGAGLLIGDKLTLGFLRGLNVL